MTPSSNIILTVLFIAFVLSALSYWKVDPDRVIASLPFLFMAIPLVLLLTVLVMASVGGVPPRWSMPCLLVSLAVLAVTLVRARVLLPKAR